jgi:multiple sugar transport system ATP-binding protein
MAQIEFDHVTKQYGDVVAVRDINVAIEDREFFCFFGPPSAGKSTLLRLLLGLEKPTDGEIRIDGKVVNAQSPAERNLAMVFQNLALFPHMSARENLRFPLLERGVAPSAIEERLGGIADKLHITHLLDKRPAQLSGGERQRVAIGRALMREATAYLMDDPISALDARLREEMRVELKRLQREIGHTFIYVTHDQEEAMSVADRMAILDHGSVRQIDAPQIIYDRPNSRYVASMVGSPTMNFLPGELDAAAGEFCSADGSLKVGLPGRFGGGVEAVDLAFRPEDTVLGAASGMTARVISVEPLGAFSIVVVESGSQRLKAMVKGQTVPKPGDDITVGVTPSRVALFRRSDGQRLDPDANRAANDVKQTREAREETQPC